MAVRHAPRIALGLLIATVVVSHLVWIERETGLMPHADAYGYLILLLRGLDKLGAGGLAASWDVVTGMSLEGRPPLYSLLTLPFAASFGRSEDAALLINTALYAALLLATFGVGRACANERVGLLAAFLVACYPPIVNLSRIYRPHFALPACVALSLWLLLLLHKRRSVRLGWLFTASLALGMLIHPAFAWVLAVPTAGLLVSLVAARDLRDRWVSRGLLPAALVCGGVVALWYGTLGRRLFSVFQAYSAPTEELIALRGTTLAVDGFEEVSTRFWWYLVTAPGALSFVFAILVGVALVGAIASRERSRLVLAATFVGAYVLVNLQPGRSWLYFAAILPVAAVLTAVWIGDLRNHRLAVGLTALCIAVGAFLFAFVSWGGPSWSRPVARALGAPLDSATCAARRNTVFCPNPPRRENWHAADILSAVLDDPDCRERSCRLLVMPNDFRIFTWWALSHRLLERWPDASLAIGWAPAGPVDKRARRKSDYLLYLDRSPPPPASDSLSFLLPNGATARLVKGGGRRVNR